jgi:hypothetical protein
MTGEILRDDRVCYSSPRDLGINERRHRLLIERRAWLLRQSVAERSNNFSVGSKPQTSQRSQVTALRSKPSFTAC